MLGGHLPCPSWPWGLPLLSPLPVLPALLGQLLMTVGEEVSTLTDALLREPTVFPCRFPRKESSWERKQGWPSLVDFPELLRLWTSYKVLQNRPIVKWK